MIILKNNLESLNDSISKLTSFIENNSDKNSSENSDESSDENSNENSDETILEDDNDNDNDNDNISIKKKSETNKVLFNIFRDNINNLPPDKKIIKDLKDKLNYKKDIQYYLNAIELLNKNDIKNNLSDYNYLYPHLDDNLFNVKIANKKEFAEHKFFIDIDENTNIEKETDKLCNREFQLAPHQEFLRKFLSIYTPYNGILLYHGLGTGKTCSAIGIAEETRNYLKYNNIKQRIIIVASPNVQQNFRLQLFDETKLSFINGMWNLENCVGNNILKDINIFDSNISKEILIKNINNIINTYYIFIGYIEFANIIIKKSKISDIDKNLNINERKIIIKKKLEKFFNNRLIIIDEIHNIRNSNDNANKLVSQQLITLVKNVSNLKLVLLSATPMYNDYKEIIFLLNILNLNDRRSTIEFSDVFENNGSFKVDKYGNDVGKELLIRKMNGYVSYVKGDNPLSFPYRILPELFNSEKSIKKKNYPKLDINNNKLKDKIDFFDLYCNNISDYQENVYNYIISKLNFDNNENYNYTLLQKPLESLIISFPNDIIEKSIPENFKDIDIPIKYLVGKNGLSNLMTFDESNEPPSKYNYRFIDYNQENIFLKKNIYKYSCKIYKILNEIENSEGPIIIYSQFIDGGIIPMTLALESFGMRRYGNNRNLFSNEILSNIEEIDSLTYKTKSETLLLGNNFNGAKYILITGDKKLTPNIKSDLKACTNINNIDGSKIKVILLTMAGSEGIDFKFIRQVHIMEPWYNINRIEQIIGRAVRTCSHKDLEFKKRNVKIYMHTTLLNENNKESVDNLLYRKSEKKVLQIGIISRLLKENSIDCHLNNELLKLTEKNLSKYFKYGFKLTLSNNEIINYNIGDKAYSPLCDYMESCEYICNNSKKLIKEEDKLDTNTYNEKHMEFNNNKIIKEIRNLFKEKFFYTKIDIILHLSSKNYSKLLISNALNELINNKSLLLIDKYNNFGTLINIDDLYIFQPENIKNINSSLYTKINPVNENIDYIKYKIPDKIKEFVPVKVVKKFTSTPDNNNNNNDKNIFNELVNRINLILNLNDNKKISKNSIDNLLINFLTIEKNIKNIFIDFNSNSSSYNTNMINYLYFKIIIIHIIIDTLKYSDLLILFKIIYFENIVINNNDERVVFNTIKKYFNDNILTKNNISVIILPKKNEDFLLSLYKINYDKKSLELCQYTDYQLFNDLIVKKYEINYKEYSIIVGFINNISENNYNIKLKTLKDPLIPYVYNDGTLCNNLSKKEIKIRFIEKIINKEKYEMLYDCKNFKTPSYCLIIDLFLRYYQIINYNNKVWFLDKNYCLYNNFIKID